ncbi:MAG: hypothetical protein ACYCST_21335 [Acidimicrobiales bacterium]
MAALLGCLATVATTASASARLPLSPTFLDATRAYEGLQIEPASITYTGDGTGFLGGADARSKSAGIEWTKWTPSRALGFGFDQLDNCIPDCAEGTFTGYRIKIEQWRPRVLAGTLVFTRMTIFFLRHTPRHAPHHYTFTDTHTSGRYGGYGWGPPGGGFYCRPGKRPYAGWKPQPGCQNIHSLPPKVVSTAAARPR